MRGNARRRQFGSDRAAYTEEPHALAASGIPRLRPGQLPAALGLDKCSDEQRCFRAFLALFLLNTPSIPPQLLLDDSAHPIIIAGVSRLLSNPILMSAQYEDLTILTDMGDHLLQCVANSSDSAHGLPGLRPVTIEGDGEALLLRHMPTGALLRFQYFDFADPRQRKPPWFYPTHWNRIQRTSTIGPNERSTIEAVPSMHDDALTLLAGLVTRLSCWHKDEGWAVGHLLHDHLEGRENHYGSYTFTHLWGSDTDWLLRWSGFGAVPPADVARALTHEIIGINGATAKAVTDDLIEVRLGKATLRLEIRREGRSSLSEHDRSGGIQP